MQTIQMQGTVGEDGKLRLEVPCQLPPGPAEVVVIVQPQSTVKENRSWSKYYGIARDIGHGQDAQEYVDQLRNEKPS